MYYLYEIINKFSNSACNKNLTIFDLESERPLIKHDRKQKYAKICKSISAHSSVEVVLEIRTLETWARLVDNTAHCLPICGTSDLLDLPDDAGLLVYDQPMWWCNLTLFRNGNWQSRSSLRRAIALNGQVVGNGPIRLYQRKS